MQTDMQTLAEAIASDPVLAAAADKELEAKRLKNKLRMREVRAAQEKPAKKKKAPKKVAKAPTKAKKKIGAASPRVRVSHRVIGKRKPKRTYKQSDNAVTNRGPKGWAEEWRVRKGNKKWAKMLRAKRKELGYTQAEFGQFFGIKQPHMANLESAMFKPGPYLYGLIMKKFFTRVGFVKPRKGAPKA